MIGSSSQSSSSTVVELLKGLADDGYTSEFGVVEGAKAKCFTCRNELSAAEMQVDATKRIEGESDPDDMAVVMGVVCGQCGAKGALVAEYGPESSVESADLLRTLNS
jgi:hypothetical protein